MSEAKQFHLREGTLVEGKSLGCLNVYLATDYAALEAECKRLLDLLADWSSHFTGPKVIGGPLSSLRERTDASITDGGDVMYFHKDRFDAALLADMAAHRAKGVV